MPLFSRSKSSDKKISPTTTPSESPETSPKPRAVYTPRYAARDCLASAPPGWNVGNREQVMMENRRRMAMSRSQSSSSLQRHGHMSRSGSELSMTSAASSSRASSFSEHRMASLADRPAVHRSYFSHSGHMGKSPMISPACWSASSTPELREEEEEDGETDASMPQITISFNPGPAKDDFMHRPDSGIGDTLPPLPEKAPEVIERQRRRWQKRETRLEASDRSLSA